MSRHILKSQQFDRSLITKLFEKSDQFKRLFDDGNRGFLREQLAGKTLFNLFYEASTRTRFSFAAAAIHLGMNVVSTENARDFSSAIKGESLEDSIRVLCEYFPDIIVLRHFEAGAAERAAKVAINNVGIVNAGDGGEQHPTQALLDLYTIQKEIGRLDNLSVCMGGDLQNGRTVRSLTYLLAKFNDINISFVSPPELAMKEDIQNHLLDHGVSFVNESDLEEALKEADVVYWTRVQKERIENQGLHVKAICDKWDSAYQIGQKEMACMRKDAILMHPLPRVNEIKMEVDQDPRSAYFRQAGNGMFVRMALLYYMLENDK